MKPENIEGLLSKARRVYREQPAEEIPLPPAFARKVVGTLSETSGSRLVMWERASYAGVALATCLTVAVWVSGLESNVDLVETSNAAELWLDMPMSEGF